MIGERSTYAKPSYDSSSVTPMVEKAPCYRAVFETMLRLCRIAVVGALCVLLAPLPALGLETDQYYAWGRPLSDSTDVINAKFNLELELAAAVVNGRATRSAPVCEDVAEQFMKQVHFTTFQEIELWALNTELVSRVPSDSEEERKYRRENLYHDNGPFDPSSWLPTVPTIEVGGVRFGTDKIAHFVSSGWRWYQGYLKAVSDGLDVDEAVMHVIQVGYFWERTMLGGKVSGVTSFADLEANFQGMQFYTSLCHGPDQRLVLQGAHWVIRRPFDIRKYIGPRWDESYNNPIFAGYRWRKVRPVLETYCDRLALPSVRAQRHYYRSIDTSNPLEEFLAGLMANGELQDPLQYSIEHVCPNMPVSPPHPSSAAPFFSAPPGAPVPDTELMRRLYRLETDVQRRTVGIAAVRLTNPERVAGSLGLLFTQIPKSYDCSTVCSFQGPLIQLGFGMGGGRLSVGWGKVVGEQNGAGILLTDPYVGLGIKGALLYTWGDPYREPVGSTFVGGEFEFSIAKVNLQAGVFYSVGGAQSTNPWLFSGGLGWGF